MHTDASVALACLDIQWSSNLRKPSSSWQSVACLKCGEESKY